MTVKNPILDFRLKLEVELKTKTDNVKGVTIADVYGDPTFGLDMSFEITKDFHSKPTNSTITVYNMSHELYNLILQEGNAFRLSCARGNQDYTPFYIGYPLTMVKIPKETVLTANTGFMKQDANADRAGQNDLETVITLANYGFAHLDKSYRADVTPETIIKDCMEALGLPRGNIDKDIEDTLKKSHIKKGFTSRGEVSKTLDTLGNHFGFTWNTNDMKMNIYGKKHTDTKTYGILLTPENSATPERQDDKFKARTKTVQKANKKKNIKGVKATTIQKEERGFMVRTQLLPYLQVGSTCILRNFGMNDADGTKYIYKLKHVGSNTGELCYTEVYCV